MNEPVAPVNSVAPGDIVAYAGELYRVSFQQKHYGFTYEPGKIVIEPVSGRVVPGFGVMGAKYVCRSDIKTSGERHYLCFPGTSSLPVNEKPVIALDEESTLPTDEEPKRQRQRSLVSGDWVEYRGYGCMVCFTVAPDPSCVIVVPPPGKKDHILRGPAAITRNALTRINLHHSLWLDPNEVETRSVAPPVNSTEPLHGAVLTTAELLAQIIESMQHVADTKKDDLLQFDARSSILLREATDPYGSALVQGWRNDEYTNGYKHILFGCGFTYHYRDDGTVASSTLELSYLSVAKSLNLTDKKDVAPVNNSTDTSIYTGLFYYDNISLIRAVYAAAVLAAFVFGALYVLGIGVG